jgi:hypothetical protein
MSGVDNDNLYDRQCEKTERTARRLVKHALGGENPHDPVERISLTSRQAIRNLDLRRRSRPGRR